MAVINLENEKSLYAVYMEESDVQGECFID